MLLELAQYHQEEAAHPQAVAAQATGSRRGQWEPQRCLQLPDLPNVKMEPRRARGGQTPKPRGNLCGDVRDFVDAGYT